MELAMMQKYFTYELKFMVYNLVTQNYLQYSIDITTEQRFRYIELTDVKIWISKDVSLCHVFSDQVT